MLSRIRLAIFLTLVVFFVFPFVVRAQVIVTLVQLADDFYRIEPGKTASLNVSENDIIENVPAFEWVLKVWQPLSQYVQFSYLDGRLTVFDPQPGRYKIYYSLSWPGGEDTAEVSITVLNSDGTDPPQPSSPLSPLYIPRLWGE
jgi:hypothetical protein